MRDFAAITLLAALALISGCTVPQQSSKQLPDDPAKLTDEQMAAASAESLQEQIILEDRTARRGDYRRKLALAWCERSGISDPAHVQRVVDRTFWVGCPTGVMLLTMGMPDRYSRKTSAWTSGERVEEWFFYGSIHEPGTRRSVLAVNGRVESIHDDQ